MNTYPVTKSRDLVLAAKENSILPHTQQIGGAMEALERITPETVSQVMSLLETDSLSSVSVVNTNLDEMYSIRNSTSGYDERVLFGLARKAIGDRSDEYRAIFSGGAFKTYASVPIVRDGEVLGAVGVYEYDASEGAIVLSLQRDLAQISVAISIASLLIAFILSQTMTYRITKVLDALKNLREGEYTYRIEVQGHDELADLSEEFNNLAGRLQRTEEQRRQFVADASHELKTPLAAIRLLSDTILETDNMDTDTVKEFVGGIREESERLARTTGQLLDLTKLDNAATVTRVSVDCEAVAGKVLGTLEPIAARDSVELRAELTDGLFIMASEDELFQIIYNLVENAIKYNKKDGSVTLRVLRRGENVVFEVEDTGIGIPDEELPYIFDRFYRVDKSRERDGSGAGGTGLGLSIVKSTAQRHGGDVTARRADSGGMLFTVTFPIYTGGQDAQN